MSEQTGSIYQVKRLSDGAIVPLTCSEADLPSFLANGYELADSAQQAEETKTFEEAQNAAADQSETTESSQS
jgi:hypothetical protein